MNIFERIRLWLTIKESSPDNVTYTYEYSHKDLVLALKLKGKLKDVIKTKDKITIITDG